MIRPQLRRFIPGTARRVVLKTADTFTASERSHSATGNSSIGWKWRTTALFTRMSTSPIAAAAAANIRSISATLPTSARA